MARKHNRSRPARSPHRRIYPMLSPSDRLWVPTWGSKHIDSAILKRLMWGVDAGRPVAVAWYREVQRRVRAAERAGRPVDLPAIQAGVPLPESEL
jgi:hypothetical protein